jgi:hypothetical protein
MERDSSIAEELMKIILCVSIVCLVFATARGNAANQRVTAPESINIKCKIGEVSIPITLKQCGHTTTTWGDAADYWCEGEINENFHAKAWGSMGNGQLDIVLTYNPAKVSAYSPMEVDGVKIDCK